MTCYADETLVTARARNYESTRRATAGVALVVGQIPMLGLELAHRSGKIGGSSISRFSSIIDIGF